MSDLTPRRRLSLRALWLVVPVAFVVFFLVAGAGPPVPSGPAVVAPDSGHLPRPPGRLLVVIVDSLRRTNVEQPGSMPMLLRLARQPGSTVLDVETCASNFSLPCIQTIFSGRESPMASGIEEFAGYGASRRQLVESAAAAGTNVALAGNDMLSTLYGRAAAARFSVQPLGLDALAADLAAIDRAGAFLRDRRNGLVILHTAGTDHVTHYDLPGSPGYARHFREVDARLAGLFAELDPAADSLVVMGDHGHDADGHHVRHSIAIFAGRRYADLFREIRVPAKGIEQKDLLYLLSYPGLIPLPADYEGRFFAPDAAPAPGSHFAAFLDLQRAELLRAWGPGAGAAVTARMDAGWQPDNEKATAALASALPLLLCLLLWIVWTHDVSPAWQPSGWATAGAGTLAAALWLLGRAGLPPAGLALVPAIATLRLAARRHGRAVLVSVLLLLAGAVVTAAIEPRWRSFFHSRDEFHWGIPVFYVVMLGAGAVVAWARSRRAAAWPWATQLAAFVALPAGVYYYQFDENPFRAYLLPAVLLLAWTGFSRLRPAARQTAAARAATSRRWPAVLSLVIAALLLVPQDAGGWQWHSWLAGQLRGRSPIASVALYLASAGALVAMVRSRRSKGPFAALLLALPLVMAGPAGLALERVVAAFVVVLFVGAWLALVAGEGAPGLEQGVSSDEAAGLMLAAAAVTIALTTCDGLLIDHVDFTFALPLTTALHGDGARLLVVAPLVGLKYAGPLLALLAFHRALRGAEATTRALGFMLLFLALKMLALLAQALVGALDTGEKFYELAQTDFVFVSAVVIVIGMWVVVLWAADLVRCVPWRGLRSMRA